MANFPPVASATESSVPVATSSVNAAANVAAVNALNAALASLTQAQASPAVAQPPTPLAPVVQAVPLPTPAVAAAQPAGFLTHGPWVVKSLYLVVPTSPLMAVVEDDEEGKLWYAITRGRWVGITLSNSLAVNAVTGAAKSNMKGYKTQAEALAVFNEMLGYNLVGIAS